MDFPSFQDLFRAARDEALYRNALLTQDAIERQGSDSNILVASGVAAADEVMTQLAKAVASLFLDSAKGTDLDKLVFDRYGLLRNPAAPSVGQVQLSLPSPAAGAFTISQGTQFGTATGIVFLSTDPSVLFQAGSSGPVTVNVQSQLAGSTQQAAIGAITSILSQISGSPAGLTVTNSAATAGAADEETDDSLKSRARLFWTTARRGTRLALEQGALAVAGVVSAKAFEYLDGSGLPAGVVELLISDAFTDTLASLNTVPPAYQTQAQTLATNVFNALVDVRACGVNVIVRVAQVVLQAFQLALTFAAGADVAATAAAAKAAVINYTNTLAPGATWSRAAAQAAVKNVSGLVYTGNEIVLPSGDVAPTALQAIRTSPELVTAYTPLSS